MLMIRNLTFIALFTFALMSCENPKGHTAIHVSFDANSSQLAQDGRLLLLLSTDDEKEPRFQ